MQPAKSSTGVRKVYGKITVDKVEPSLNEKKHQAQIRQSVTNIYPGVRAGNSLNDALFPAEAFGTEAQEYTEQRVGWIDVPVGTTAEQVQQALDKLPNARLVRILDLKPILSEEQKRAMETGLSKKADGNLLTLNDYREKQAVRDSKTKEKIAYKGHEQYRVIAFMRGDSGPVEDIDMRDETLASAEPVHFGQEMLKDQYSA
jgi:hypothetical protein